MRLLLLRSPWLLAFLVVAGYLNTGLVRWAFFFVAMFVGGWAAGTHTMAALAARRMESLTEEIRQLKSVNARVVARAKERK